MPFPRDPRLPESEPGSASPASPSSSGPPLLPAAPPAPRLPGGLDAVVDALAEALKFSVQRNMKDLATATGTAAGQVVEQGSPAVEDPEATACIQQLESLLELERGLREGAEMQVVQQREQAHRQKLTLQAVAASYKKTYKTYKKKKFRPFVRKMQVASYKKTYKTYKRKKKKKEKKRLADPDRIPAQDQGQGVEGTTPQAANTSSERDWAGLPGPALQLVARKLAEGAERAAADLPEHELGFGWVGDSSTSVLFGGYATSWGPRKAADPDRQRDGLLCFALVCRSFRAAQVELGGQLRTRVGGLLRHELGDAAGLLTWAVAEAGCPTQAEADPGWEGYDGGNHPRLTLCSLAASRGNLAALMCLRGEGFEWNKSTPAAAAAAGQLAILQWLRHDRDPGRLCPWDESVPLQAAFHGHVDILRWLQRTGWPCTLGEIGATARDEVRAEGQTLGLPDHEYGAGLMSMLAEQALIGGAIGTIQYLVAEGAYELSYCSCRDAAQGGSKEMIQWLLGQGSVSLYSEVSEFAAMNGQLDLLRWLIKEKNCPANSKTWAAAMDGGRAVEAYLLSLGADQLGWAERVFKDGSWVDPADA